MDDRITLAKLKESHESFKEKIRAEYEASDFERTAYCVVSKQDFEYVKGLYPLPDHQYPTTGDVEFIPLDLTPLDQRALEKEARHREYVQNKRRYRV